MVSRQLSRRRTLRRLTIVAAITGLLVAVAAVLHTVNLVQNQRLLSNARTEGLAAYQQGRLDEALEPLTLFNARKPGDPEVTLALASARGERPDATREDTRAAANLALAAARLMPGEIEPVLLEIRLRTRIGQHTELLDAANRALAIDGTNADAATARVRALAALGQRDDALDAAIEFARELPNDPDSHRLVLVLLTGLDPANAAARVRDYAETIEAEHPDDPRFIVLVAQAYAQVRAFDRAAAAADRLLEPEISRSLNAPTLADATQILDILGKRAAADQLLAGFLEREPGSADIASISIERAYKQGRIDTARLRARAALNKADQRTDELLMWARLTDIEAQAPQNGFHATIVRGLDALAARDPANAARSFDLAARERPASRVAMHLRAVAADRLGSPRDAARIRERLLRLAPDYTIARLAHIQALLDAGQPDRAAAFARLGLQIEPDSGGIALAYAVATAERAAQGHARRIEIEQALGIARSLDTQDRDADANARPPATPASPTHARLLIAAGRTAQAETVIERILASASIDAAPLLPLAAEARAAGLPAATDLLALAERTAQDDPAALLAVATAVHQQGRTADALALVDRAAAAPNAGRAIRLARAVFLDRIASPDAASQFAAIFQEAPNDPGTLTVILESDAAWSDAALINAAVTALQNTTADASDAWRFYEARRLLRFEPSQARAAEAVRLLEPLASTEATSPRVNVILADALITLGDAKAAMNQLALAADSGLDDPALLLRLGWMHHAEGDVESARRRARAAAVIEPVDPALRRQRVALLATVGLLDQAADDADALAATGSPTDLALAASIAARAGDDQARDQRLRALEQIDRIPGPALTVAGDLLIRTGRVARAFELIEANRPTQDTAPFARAEAAVLLAAQQTDRGTERLLDAYRLSDSPADAARAAQVLASLSRTDDAIGLIDAALAASPDDPTLTTLRQAIELDNAAISVSGNNPEAAERTIAAIKRQIDNPTDTGRFLDDLRWVTASHPTYYPAWALLTDRLSQLGRPEEAADVATAAMQVLPTDPRPARLAVRVLLELNPPTRALGAAREWQTRSRPDTYEPDTTAAALLVRLGRIDEATALLERWADRIERDPDVPPVLFRLYAASLITSGRADDAADLFARRRAADRRWADHQLEVVRDLINYHDTPDLARGWLERSAELTELDPEAALRAAQAAVDLADRTGQPDDLDRAIALAEQAAAEGTTSARLLLAQAHRFARNPEAARRIADELRSEDQNNPYAWMVFALASIESGDEPEQALQAARRAVELGGEDSLHLLDTLGRALLAADQLDDAERTFRQAIGIESNAPGPRVGLAETLAAKLQAADARRIAGDPLLLREVRRHTLLERRLERLTGDLERQSRAD